MTGQYIDRQEMAEKVRRRRTTKSHRLELNPQPLLRTLAHGLHALPTELPGHRAVAFLNLGMAGSHDRF